MVYEGQAKGKGCLLLVININELKTVSSAVGVMVQPHRLQGIPMLY